MKGVFLAVHTGLLLCNVILFVYLKLYRWFRLSALGPASLLMGAVLLALLFAGIRNLAFPAILLLAFAGLATLAIGWICRWIVPADLHLFGSESSSSEISLE